MQFDNKTTRSVADAVEQIMAEALKGSQHKIDANKNNKIDAHDFELLRKKKKVEEDFEQLDELSKGTLRNYLKGSRAENQGALGSAGHMSDKARSLGRTDQDKEDGRYEGAKSAKKRLNAMKEEQEQLGEASTYKLGRAAAETKDFPIHHNGEHVGTLEFHTSAGKLHHRVSSIVGVPHEKFIGHPDREKMTNAHVAKHEAEARKHFAKNIKEDAALAAETILEYEAKSGVYKHKGTYGSAKGAEYGATDYKKENELAKAADKEKKKPARKAYGARQNFVRAYAKESFSGMMGVYKEGGLKSLHEALVKEEPTNAEFTAELQNAKDKADLKKKQPDLAKPSVQAVKVEENLQDIHVINVDIANGVEIEDIQERSLTEPEMKKKEEIVMGMKKNLAGFKDRYGDRAKNVIYATATKSAKKD